jgi:hypothetical protein
MGTLDEDFDVTEAMVSAMRRKAASAGRFIGCPMWWWERALAAVDSKGQLVVAVYVWRRHVLCRKNTFGVPNGQLDSWGVTRQVKYRALAQLAEAGLIKIERNGREALTVTILARAPKRSKRRRAGKRKS